MNLIRTIKPASGRTDFKEWQKSVQEVMRKLCRMLHRARTPA